MEVWENISNGIVEIKDAVSGFFSICSSVFTLIPSPFKEILWVVLAIVICCIAIKIVRG